jgi:nucleoside-diphosphate-sugar epimerase
VVTASGATLVLGATGFLGRHLLALLAGRPGEVRALVRNPAAAGAMRELGAETVPGDVLDRAALEAACAGCGLVYNLAGLVSHRRRDRARLEAVNVGGVRNVLDALEPGARLVHVSSVAAVGPAPSPDRPVDEDNVFPPFADRYVYASTKRAGESLVLAAAEHGADAVVANPGFLLGPDDVNSISTWTVQRYLSGWLRFTAPGGLSYADARDVAAGLVALAERGRAGERYILTSREGNLSHHDFFARVGAVTGVRRRQVLFPRRVALAASRAPLSPVHHDEVEAACNWWFFDPAKAERELGFATRPIDETIAATAAQYRGAR